MRANDDTEIDADVTSANSILQQIADLNGQIGQLVLAGAQLDPATLQVVKPGQVPNDLLDRRDLLLDNLAKLANVTQRQLRRPEPRHRGRGRPDGGDADRRRDVPLTRAQIDAQFTSGALTGGALHGLEDAYQNLLNEANATSYPAQLNTLAQSLHDAVNAQHALGSDLSGTAGGLFFDFTLADRAARRRRPPDDVGGDPREPGHDRRRRHRPGPRLGHERERHGRAPGRDHDRRHDLPRLLQRAPVRARHRHPDAPPARRTHSRSS